MTTKSAIVVEMQGGLMRVREFSQRDAQNWHHDTQPKRSIITEFSQASRRRFGRMLATLDPTQPMHFMTLTFSENFPDVATAKRHLRTFFKRIQRIAPEVVAIWKLEFQRRGAPHFHLLLLNWHYIDQARLLSMWQDVCKDKNIRHLDIRTVHGDKQRALRYIAKYMRKKGLFTNDAYLAAYPESTIGRFWGVMGNGEIAFAKYEAVVFAGDTFSMNLLLAFLVKWYDLQMGIDRDYPIQKSATYYGDRLTMEEVEQDLIAVSSQIWPTQTVLDFLVDNFQIGVAGMSMAQRNDAYSDIVMNSVTRYYIDTQTSA